MVSGIGTMGSALSAERRWAAVGVVIVLSAVAVEVAVGYVRQGVSPEPSTLAKVETCLTERATPFAPVTDDRIAMTASRGALHTTVQGNSVTVALAASERDARRVYDDYVAVAPEGVVRSQLERQGRVVLLWSRAPSTAQRDFMLLCTLDAQP